MLELVDVAKQNGHKLSLQPVPNIHFVSPIYDSNLFPYIRTY